MPKNKCDLKALRQASQEYVDARDNVVTFGPLRQAAMRTRQPEEILRIGPRRRAVLQGAELRLKAAQRPCSNAAAIAELMRALMEV